MGGPSDWLTVAQAAEAEGIAERTMREKIKAKEVKAKKVKSQNGGGAAGSQWLIDPSTLSAPARARLLKKQQAALLKEAFKEQAAAVQASAPAEAEKAKRTGTALEGEEDVLNPAAYRDAVGAEVYEEELAKARSKHDLVNQAIQIQMSKHNVTQRLKALAEANGMSDKTLYRMIAKSKKGGAFGQLRKRPTVTRGKEFTSLSPEVKVIFREFYLKLGEPTVASCYRKTEKECARLGLAAPSRQTIYRYAEYMEKTEPDLCCYARRGEKAWFEKYAPHAVREEPEMAMQVVMGDHHQFDLFIEHDGKPVRPWVTGWLDVMSRCLVGYTISLQPNSQTINLALVNMMTPKKVTVTREDGSVAEETIELGGIPGLLYIDNGEDYKSALKKRQQRPEFKLSQEATDICEKLGVDTTFALPYRPSSKAHIERFFGTVAKQFSREQPGWCGANPDERPAGFNEHKLMAKGLLHTMTTLAQSFAEYVHQYHNTFHSGIGMAPLEKFFAGPKLREGWPDQRTLDILRTTKEVVHVYHQGIKKFGTKAKPRYWWHDKLRPLVGRDVIIRYDPAQIGELHVFTLEDGYVCTVTDENLMSWNATRDDYRKLAKQQSMARKAIKEKLQKNSLTLEEIAAKRRAAGESIISAPTGAAEGMMPAITGLDQAARQVAKFREKAAKSNVTEMRPAPKKHDPIDEYILRKGARA
ncbi:Mu transposase C-terminal domain-containing protein [Pelotomaculum propionicicum]|uniref:Integrase catalytic domain-containing protein n=1 Tax=Pelotomaculum propionicicum TaxID=258475 RepID=A0A4Y7RNT7_9FIRM|nr:Mu transposase C-terminal domain-containing protein [Pelotomaculum propionicicum]TEB10654.1 hypothetical protein Pmgp_02234 [Pelotomaculum propionicicum]